MDVARDRRARSTRWGNDMAQETTATTMESGGFRPIPTPPDFPVTWEHPDEARLFWTREVMHGPDQVAPMNELYMSFITHGFAVAGEAYAMPIRVLYRVINTYVYSGVAPAVPPEQMEAQGKKAEEALGAALGLFNARWETEFLPELERHLALCERFDLP